MGIRSRAARAYGHDSPYTLSPLAVVEHLISRKPTIARNTWKQYKNSLRYHFEHLAAESPDKLAKQELQAAVTLLNATSSEGALKYGTQTSSRKQKGCKRADYEKLQSYLARHVGKHRYAGALRTWLEATRLTGLRPGEWEFARLGEQQGKQILHVRNAKATNGRGNGEERTLDLSMLSAGEMELLQDMIQMLEGYAAEVGFEQLQKAVSDYMYAATRGCFGKRKKYPSLYSMRHQFSADAKMSGSTKAEVAALMGHGSDETAGTHYAPKASGNSVIKVAPLGSEVKRVRAKAKTFRPRNQKDAGSG
jgi:integrase